MVTSGSPTFITQFYNVPTQRVCVRAHASVCGSQNKQQLLPTKTLSDWFC